jgi:hypothetical protein
MDFIEELQLLSKQIREKQEIVKTEAAARLSFV